VSWLTGCRGWNEIRLCYFYFLLLRVWSQGSYLIPPLLLLLAPSAFLSHAEVFLGKPYNETADTFSFCVLCWQILAMETPYEGFTVKMFEKSVIKGGARPKINDSWGETVVGLLQQSFVGTATTRPYMTDVCEQLREELNKLSDDEIIDIVDASRKSQLSAR
jgi:Protein tyrosine and serine/threonine kinase